MRNIWAYNICSSALYIGAFMIAGDAYSQTASSGVAPKGPAGALSVEDQNATPYPPGPHAALVKKVCTGCHGAEFSLNMHYTKDDAERFYKNMVSHDLTTDQAKQVIEYLSTTLGEQ